VTGVGHETDFTLADFAADRRALTPTDAARLTVPDAENLRGRVLSLAEDAGAALSGFMGGRRLSVERMVSRLDRSRDIINDARQVIEDRTLVLSSAVRERVRSARDIIGGVLRRAAESHPRQRVNLMKARCGDLSHRLAVATNSGVREKRRRLSDAGRLLHDLSPLAVLDRGYSIVIDRRGALVRDARDVSPGEAVQIRFAKGLAAAEITKAEFDDTRKAK
jgi:exodeoxyribonuclease VII large subunit